MESVECKGWFLYSASAMDHKYLAETIESKIGVLIFLRWKYTNTEQYENMDKDERRKWMALHIEVDTKEGRKASRGLARLYESTANDFPLGIRMQLVSEF